jgi:hypothetical protein
MRTLQSGARRLIRQYIPGDPPMDRLADALVWVLFTSGHLKKRRHRGHGSKTWRQRAIYGGTYGPRTP